MLCIMFSRDTLGLFNTFTHDCTYTVPHFRLCVAQLNGPQLNVAKDYTILSLAKPGIMKITPLMSATTLFKSTDAVRSSGNCN